MDEESAKLTDQGYELASYFVDHAMDKTENNGMLASLALGMAYASLMCSNRISEDKAVALVRGVYQRAARLEELMGGSRETH
jgi:hypothetical protein